MGIQNIIRKFAREDINDTPKRKWHTAKRSLQKVGKAQDTGVDWDANTHNNKCVPQFFKQEKNKKQWKEY